MLRVFTIAVLLCASEAAFAQELTSAQRDACMGDYQKYCKGRLPYDFTVAPRRRTD